MRKLYFEIRNKNGKIIWQTIRIIKARKKQRRKRQKMIEFRKITWDNFDECINLQLTEEQRGFLASNVYSLAQSYVALLNDELPP